jgi:hypothetical protein
LRRPRPNGTARFKPPTGGSGRSRRTALLIDVEQIPPNYGE